MIIAGKVCALRLYGPVPAVKSWLPVAKTMLEKLVRGGEAVGQKEWSKPQPGVYIEVGQVTDTTAYVLIKAASSPGYMESGYLDYRTWQPGRPEFYLPAIIRFNAPVAALPQKTYPNASALRPVHDGDLSQALGVGYAQRAVTLPGGSVISGKYCDPGKIAVDKTMHQWVVPSVYTGLLRLYVQGLYGSKARDYGPALDTWGFKLAIAPAGQARRTAAGQYAHVDDIPLYWHSDGKGLSSGLYRAPKAAGKPPRYWLIQVQWDGLFAIEMRPAAPIVPLKDYWSDPRQEAHYLAGLRPRGAAMRIGDSAHVILGDARPIAYGFHFNADGSRAILTGVEATLITGTRRQAGPPIPARSQGMKATRFLLALTDGDQVDSKGQPIPPSAQVTREDRGSWMPWMDQAVWVPEYWRGAMVMAALQPYNDPMDPGYTGWDVERSGSAEIYSFFDATGAVQALHMSNVVTSRTEAKWLVAEADYEAVFNYSTETLGDGGVRTMREQTQGVLTIPPQTITAGGVGLGRESVIAAGTYFTWQGGMAGNGAWDTGFSRYTRPWLAGASAPTADPVILTGTQDYSAVFGTQTRHSISTHVTSLVALVPWDDASAVYLVERQYQYGQFKTVNEGVPRYTADQWGMYKIRYKLSIDAGEQEAYLRFTSSSEFGFTNSGGGPIANLNFDPAAAKTSYSDPMFLDYTVSIVTAHGTFPVYSEHNEYTPGDPADGVKMQDRIYMDSFFEPRADDPFFHARIAAREPHFSPDVWTDPILPVRSTGSVHWPTQWPHSDTNSPVGFV